MLKDFVLETANAPGTATTVNLAGAATGRCTFAQKFSSGANAYYYLDDGTQAEWGWGVFTSGSPNTITRAVVLGNTAGTTARLNFAGVTRVYNEVPSSAAPYFNTDSTLSLPAVPGTGDSSSKAISSAWAQSSLLGGSGQTWQSLAGGSRTSGVTYTNTTGRALFVAVTAYSSAGSVGISYTLSGIATPVASSANATENYGSVFFIVPAGATYRVSVVTGGVTFWGELR